MKSKRAIIILTLVIIGLGLAAWLSQRYNYYNSKASDQVEYIIGVSQANMREEWRVALVDELNNSIKNYDNIRIITTDATSSVDKQMLDLDKLIGYDVDLLIISPVDEVKMTSKIEEVYKKGLPVIVMDRAIEGFDYTLYIGPDNTRIGSQAGEYIVEYLGESGGKSLELQGVFPSTQSLERSNGYNTVMNDHPEIERDVLYILKETKDSAYDGVIGYINRMKDVDVIYAHSDAIALGAYNALKEVGLEDSISIIGSDGFTGKNEGIDLVKSQKLSATISCPVGGKEALEYAMDILQNKSGVPKQVILRSYTITANNADEYLEKMSATYEDKNETIKVGYSQIGQESTWRITNTKSIIESAQAFNIDLHMEDANQSQAKQIEDIRQFIDENVDVIVLSPVVETGWDEVLKEAKDAGIPVVTSDRNVILADKNADYITTYIGADLREEGRRAMRWLRDEMPKTDSTYHIMQLMGNKGASPTVERQEGFEEIMKQCPGFEISYSEYGNFTYDGGKAILEKYLAYHEWDMDIIYAQNDDMALGAIDALKSHDIVPGDDVIIISVDATKPAFVAMNNGDLNCTVECNPLIGNQLMKAIRDLVSGKTMPFRIITEEKIYDQNDSELLINQREY